MKVKAWKAQVIEHLKTNRCDLVGVMGRNAFHVFDKISMNWICSNKYLGYGNVFSEAEIKPFDVDKFF